MKRRPISALLIGAGLMVSAAGGASSTEQQSGMRASAQMSAEAPSSATVPFILDHNRMIVNVEFVRPDGTVRKARAWVDTGNDYILVLESLARDLGYDLSPVKQGEGGQSAVRAVKPPPLRLGGFPLNVEGLATQIEPNGALPGLPVEAQIPAGIFLKAQAVFDYPARLLTVARPGSLKPRGSAIPCRVNPETGLFMVEARIDGEAAALGIDNGSSYTWVSEKLTSAWTVKHSDWPRSIGAVGAANFFGFPFEAKGALMRIPRLEMGSIHVPDVGLLGLDARMFAWYSKKSAGTVAGFIGANVLKGFRLELDLPNGMTYWEAGPTSNANDLDIVGLTLRPEADGSFTVAGIAIKNGRPTVEGIQAGDKLIRVDALDTKNATMGTVIDALRGKPGTSHALIIEREGKQITVQAIVIRFP